MTGPTITVTTAPRPELVGIVPEVLPLKAMKLPAVAERTLPNGLRVVAARRSGVPRLEARLVVPAARGGKAAAAAQATLLSKTLLSGTATRSGVEIAQELQRIGGNLDAHGDSDTFVLHGSTLAAELPRFLDLLRDVLVEASYPEEEVAVQRDVAAQEIALALSQPGTIARHALSRRLYGDHPYGRGLPLPEDVAAVTPAELRKLHRSRVRPDGGVLVLVGDVPPNRAVDLAEAALVGWERGRGAPGLRRPVATDVGPTLIVHRPGSVQTTIRMGGRALGRTDPDHPKLALANLVFGGYFVSRLVDNIRERRGYTYSAGSSVQQHRQAAALVVGADVATEVTGPALVEMRYELHRMLAGPIEATELASAKRYLSGTISMSIQTQSGLAGFLATLALDELPVGYLRDFPARVDALTAADVVEASRRHFDPRRLHTVMVGDADAIAPVVEAFDDVEVERA